MRSAETIKKLIKNTKIKTNPEVNKAVLDGLLDRMDRAEGVSLNASQQNTWSIIMKSKITKLATAAVIIIVVLIGMNQFSGPFGGTSVAYGITDVPDLLRSSKTFHVQALRWIYQNNSSQSEFLKATVISMETWLDIPNMRERFTSYEGWSRPDTGERGLNKIESFRDQEYAISIEHNKKTVRFNKFSLTKQMMKGIIDKYVNNLISQKQLDSFIIVGRETIGGTIFDIWEREGHYPDGMPEKIRCWVSPETGELGRIYYWAKISDTGLDNWLPSYFIEKIERDITIPDSIFEFNAPQDYTYQNTKETAL